tara:strand:- start:43 stop:210 length:168 start_codon:yes stop_codon:yes gene_type:complete
MKIGDLVRYTHPDDRREYGDPIGIVIKKFQRDTTVLWTGDWLEEDIDSHALEVIQ